MAQALFEYAPDDVALLRPFNPLAATILADRHHVRAEMAEDAAAAGLRVHLANGLYVNALFDRLLGGWSLPRTTAATPASVKE